ncbi:uncharacterized protein [Bos mutus]|uniref:uncharacterized protein n=1 Tax=Bos mutus TaxID=72004 RepID=UPI0038B604E9
MEVKPAGSILTYFHDFFFFFCSFPLLRKAHQRNLVDFGEEWPPASRKSDGAQFPDCEAAGPGERPSCPEGHGPRSPMSPSPPPVLLPPRPGRGGTGRPALGLVVVAFCFFVLFLLLPGKPRRPSLLFQSGSAVPEQRSRSTYTRPPASPGKGPRPLPPLTRLPPSSPALLPHPPPSLPLLSPRKRLRALHSLLLPPPPPVPRTPPPRLVLLLPRLPPSPTTPPTPTSLSPTSLPLPLPSSSHLPPPPSSTSSLPIFFPTPPPRSPRPRPPRAAGGSRVSAVAHTLGQSVVPRLRIWNSAGERGLALPAARDRPLALPVRARKAGLLTFVTILPLTLSTD